MPDPSTLLNHALGYSDSAARAAFLDRACGSDAALRSMVEELLRGTIVDVTRTHAPDGANLVTAEFEPDPNTRTFGSDDRHRPIVPPDETMIAGRYELLDMIGEGGMGSVYLARQVEPVRRQVAVKLIKSGLNSRDVLARFDAERQALALMDHPNIARIFDGGVTRAGQPYFVMEWVQGSPLTRYCDDRRLSVAARLQLFVAVCRAVQHAHQKGVIHRDLKPGNILVTEVDGRPTPKVIDFGVAKATEQPLTDMSLSDTGAIVGTPTYMSPEQADPTAADIDTRTDVYALGVILYELLVGSPPLDARQFKRGAVLEMLRMIREVEPPRPSTKLSATVALPDVAARRSIEPAELSRLLQGELDWVVMKAIEKDRTRRYETADGLARDILRYLADEVVEARPPTAAYRARKFVRRHRGPVIAAAVVLFALLASVVVSVTAAVLIWEEQKKTEAERVKATESAETAVTVVHELSDYVNLIESDQAVSDSDRKAAVDASLAGYVKLLGLYPDDVILRSNVARMHGFRANLCRLTNEPAEAEASYHEAIRLYRDLLATDPGELSYRTGWVLTCRDYAFLVGGFGRLREADNLLADVTRQLGEGGPDADSLRRVAAILLLDRAGLDYQTGRFAESETKARTAAEIYADLAKTPTGGGELADPLFRGMAEIEWACALRELGRIDDALVIHTQAVDRLTALGQLRASRDTLHESFRARAERARTLSHLPDRHAAALADLDAAVAGGEKLVQQFPEFASYRRSHATWLLGRGTYQAGRGNRLAARTDLTAAATIWEGLAAKQPDVPVYRGGLGRTFAALGRLDGDPEWVRKARVELDAAVRLCPEGVQDRKALAELKE